MTEKNNNPYRTLDIKPIKATIKKKDIQPTASKIVIKPTPVRK